MATKPRQIIPGRTWFVTGRAIARQHRFVPKKRVVETIWYCLAVASEKYEVQLHGFVWMSNHYHLVLTDVEGQLPDFMRDLNSLISKALNAFRGFEGQNYERRGYNAVVVADSERALRHCAYAEANPCRAHLVGLAKQWESVTSARMEYGEERAVHRPDYGLWGPLKGKGSSDEKPDDLMYSGRIKCPKKATLRLVRPPRPEAESPEETREQVRSLVREFEQEACAERNALGRGVMGMRAARRVDFCSSPEREGASPTTEPEVSGSEPGVRQQVKREIREFVARYQHAREEYRRSGEASFPEGTWWMRRVLNRRCYFYCASG